MSLSRAAPSVTPLQDLDVAITAFRRFWNRPAIKERFLAELGQTVTPSLYTVLRAVASAEADEPCVGDVAADLNVDASTASRFVAEAVTAGLVSRATSKADRRRSVLRVTPQGRHLLRRGAEVRMSLLAEITSEWAEDDVETLAVLLARLAHGAGDLA
jgi:DNA-binding MarR family transcriptional regulator